MIVSLIGERKIRLTNLRVNSAKILNRRINLFIKAVTSKSLRFKKSVIQTIRQELTKRAKALTTKFQEELVLTKSNSRNICFRKVRFSSRTNYTNI